MDSRGSKWIHEAALILALAIVFTVPAWYSFAVGTVVNVLGVFWLVRVLKRKPDAD